MKINPEAEQKTQEKNRQGAVGRQRKGSVTADETLDKHKTQDQTEKVTHSPVRTGSGVGPQRYAQTKLGGSDGRAKSSLLLK